VSFDLRVAPSRFRQQPTCSTAPPAAKPIPSAGVKPGTLVQVTIRFSGAHSSQRPSIGFMAEFVPPDFEVPLGLETSDFVLEPLGAEHNEQDYAAWSSSIEHIRATPGFPDGSWPREMTLDDNLVDLRRHAADFRNRKGFTYTVV